MATGEHTVYLKHLPLGVWVLMDKYADAPFTRQLHEADGTLHAELTKSLVFVEPRTSESFLFRGHRVTRTGWPFSHGRVITCTACQGRTMHEGVVIDCGRHEGGAHPKDDDDWWLDLYVMLSRATRLEDFLLNQTPN